MSTKSLQKFGEVLLQHIVNDAKVPISTVQSHYQDWETEKQTMETDHLKLEETYMENHENPRHEAEMLYAQYVSQKTEAFLRYENSPPEQKAAALEEYVRIHPPQELRQSGVLHDFVYTKIRAQLKHS